MVASEASIGRDRQRAEVFVHCKVDQLHKRNCRNRRKKGRKKGTEEEERKEQKKV